MPLRPFARFFTANSQKPFRQLSKTVAVALAFTLVLVSAVPTPALGQAEAERDQLLARDKNLLTAELWQALVARGDRQRSHGDFAQAVAVYALAQTVAERIGDKAGVAKALNNRRDPPRHRGPLVVSDRRKKRKEDSK